MTTCFPSIVPVFSHKKSLNIFKFNNEVLHNDVAMQLGNFYSCSKPLLIPTQSAACDGVFMCVFLRTSKKTSQISVMIELTVDRPIQKLNERDT